jgi:hypothetical protein
MIAAVAGALAAITGVALGSYELADGRWTGLFWFTFAAGVHGYVDQERPGSEGGSVTSLAARRE